MPSSNTRRVKVVPVQKVCVEAPPSDTEVEPENDGDFDGQFDDEEETFVEQQNMTKVCPLSQISTYRDNSNTDLFVDRERQRSI